MTTSTFEEQLTALLAYQAAVNAVRNIRITPTVHGGVEVSWNNYEVQLEWDATGELVSVYWDRSDLQRKEANA